MDIVAAVLALFPSGDGQEEGVLEQAVKALDGLPELNDDQATACGDAVWSYEDFRAEPGVWLAGKEADKAHPFWQRLAGPTDQEPSEEATPDESEDPVEEPEDLGENDPSPDARQGLDADALSQIDLTTGGGGGGDFDVDELLGVDPEGDGKKNRRKGRDDRDDDDPEWRVRDRELKELERKARLDQTADKHRWQEEDRAFKQAETDLRAEERRAKLEREAEDRVARAAETARKAELHRLAVEERALKLEASKPPVEPSKEYHAPASVLLILANPVYLAGVIEITELRKTISQERDLALRLQAVKDLAKLRAKILRATFNAKGPKRAANVHLLEMFKALERGDDVTYPNSFKGNFVTGHWIAD